MDLKLHIKKRLIKKKKLPVYCLLFFKFDQINVFKNKSKKNYKTINKNN